MNAIRTERAVFHLARADLLERIRRSSFLVVLVSAVFAGFLAVPPVDAGYRVLQVGTQRGVYDSAWIGLMFGLIAALHLPLAGFFLVKNAVERDRQTGVGEIIATTPIRKLVYVLGKWLSNVAVLVLILGVMTAMAVVMQLVRSEDMTIQPGALVPTIWLMALPVLAIAAALAVLFECTPVLRSGWGNAIFLCLWLFSLAAVLGGSIDEETGLLRPGADLFSFSAPMASIQEQVLAANPEANVSSGLIITGREIEGTFVWDRFRWKAGTVLERLRWLGLALLLSLAAAIPFDRFDPARRQRRPEGTVLHSRQEPTRTTALRTATITKLTPLPASARRWRFPDVLAAELKLMLKGRSRLWTLGAIGLNVACLLIPSAAVQRYLLLPSVVVERYLPAAVWLWPLVVWAQMGARERRFNTGQMVFSAPRPALRQLPATWLAGVVVAVVATSGAWLHLALTGELVSLLGSFAGALFVPALALVLGVWTGSSRVFEAGYLFLWYLGALEGLPTLDITGASAARGAMRMPLVYLALSAGLVGLAMIGRWRRVRA
jgi:ABC-type transport system involved in multi-copper enzyme maturation permease subunit